MNRESSPVQLALFRHTFGPAALRVINGLTYSPDKERGDWQVVVVKMEQYCLGESNETCERYIFNRRRPQHGESLDAFVLWLKSLDRSCNFFACLEKRLIRDRIVVGLRNSAVVKRRLKIPKLRLKPCINICRSEEAAWKHMETLTTTEDYGLCKIASENRTHSTVACRFCGRIHLMGRSNCPAWGKTCDNCKKRNHFAAKCFGKKKSTSEHHVQAVDHVSVVQLPAKRKGIFANMLMNGEVTFQLDSGASVNIISRNRVYDTKLDPTQTRLVMWNGANVEPKGQTTTTLKNPRNGVSSVVSFVVVESVYVPILGYESIE
ncbi:unnamed protein product [Echinostoma caproni]|uniref:Peptidase A2 domain-containing protein n=1 Tax=Echinostoma caproni TaxID=27848 RepID=A0A183ACP9_9TREM|nr:unnamed protein product [Echinostoma caproni]